MAPSFSFLHSRSFFFPKLFIKAKLPFFLDDQGRMGNGCVSLPVHEQR